MFWFLHTHDWATPFFVTGCIQFIPIVGAMNLLGWYMATRDHLRGGWCVLPRGNFDYLNRGARLWLVLTVYELYALIPVALIGIVVWVTAVMTHLAWSTLDWWILGAGLLLVWILALLPLGFVSAALLDVADGMGMGFALNPVRVWAVAMADARNSWRVFGAYLLGFLFYGLASSVLAFIPLGSVLAVLMLPGVYLMAAPAQAEFKGTAPRPA
jgi:hypothetical protein